MWQKTNVCTVLVKKVLLCSLVTFGRFELCRPVFLEVWGVPPPALLGSQLLEERGLGGPGGGDFTAPALWHPQTAGHWEHSASLCPHGLENWDEPLLSPSDAIKLLVVMLSAQRQLLRHPHSQKCDLSPPKSNILVGLIMSDIMS